MKIRILLCILFLLTGNILIGQTYNQLGSDINGIALDNFGTTVASSADGSIIAASSTTELLRGEVKVYALSGTAWVQRGVTLSGEANSDNFGNGLAMSADGSILAIGAPANQATFGEFSSAGRVYIYEWDGSSDYTQIEVLDASASGEFFGDAVSISNAGDILAVGATSAAGGGNNRGVVRVYKRSGNNYLPLGTDINGAQDFKSFGFAVDLAITATDSILVVSEPFFSAVPGNNDDNGQVSIYSSADGSWGSTWSTPQTILGDLNAVFGNAVSLTDDGTQLAVGTSLSLFNPINTYVEVYEHTTSWQLKGNRITSSISNDEFSKSVALAGDGSRLLVGAPGFVDPDSPNGYVNIYEFATSDWNRLDSIVGEASEDIFGTALATTTTGEQFVVGAGLNDTGGDAAGQVQVYELFVPDVTPPTVALSSNVGAITNTNPLNITITFSEEITAFEVADISVANATVSNLNTTDNIVYTADITGSQDGEYTVSIAADALTDIAGNGNEASNSLVYTLDTQAPTAQVASLVTNNKRPVLTGTVNDANATIQITISGTSASLLTATNNGTTWELAAGSITNELPDGTYNVVLNVEDPAGNAVAITSEGALTVDATAPTITVEEFLTNNAQPTISGTVSDALSGVASVQVLIDENTIAATLDENNNWNAAISSDLVEGTYDITVTALDVAGNEATLTETNVVTIDLTAPTVTIQGLPAEIGFDAVPITFAFSEAVTGFEASDISVSSNATLSDFAFASSTTTATATIAVLEGTEKGATMNLSIAANTFTDLSGLANNNAASVSAVFSFKYSGGSGKVADPYLIGNESDLREISANTEDYDSSFVQIANIEMSSSEYTPIGSRDLPFTGSFNGQYFQISGLQNVKAVPVWNINTFQTERGKGLFGTILNATLSNISLSNIDISSVGLASISSVVGGLVAANGQGSATGDGEAASLIENCIVSGKISMPELRLRGVGGLVGISLSNIKIESCFTSVRTESQNSNIGGLLGDQLNYELEITSSYSNSILINNSGSDPKTGGLVGDTRAQIRIDDSYFSGKIETMGEETGGLIGEERLKETQITNSFWDTDLSGVATSPGGGTGLSTADMRKRETYSNGGWDLTNIWFHSGPGYHPVLKWQVDNAKPFTVSGKVVDKDGEPFSAGTAKALFFTLTNKTVDLAEDGSFTLEDIPGFIHSIVIEPDSGETEHVKTFYGDANRSTLSRHVYNSVSGIQIQMIAKSDQNQLTGNGVVNGRVVGAGTGNGRIVQGRILDGEGLEGVTVFLVRTSDEEILTQVQTDANGDFEITGIPAGEYQLLLDVVGIDVNLEGSTFTMDEEGSELTISAAVSEEGITFAIEEVLGIENEIEVSVYPNPVRDFVNVQIPGKAVARIIDVNGTVLKEESFTDNLKLNISELNSNMYFLEITNAKGKAMKKLVKK